MANPKKGTSQARNEFIWGWAFILPTMLGLIILNIYPIFKTIYESFFKTGDFGKGNIFIGFDNYVKLFHDAEVWQALLNTFKYAIVEVPFSIAIALVLAVLLNRKMKGRAVYRTISSCLWLLLRLQSPWYGDGCLTQNSVFSITFFTQRSTGSLIRRSQFMRSQ